MPDYDETYAALIKDDEVANTIVVDPSAKDWGKFRSGLLEDYDAVEIVGERERPSPGWLYNEADNDWEAPPREPTPEPEPDEYADEVEALRGKAERVANGQAQFTPAERDQLDALRLLGRL